MATDKKKDKQKKKASKRPSRPSLGSGMAEKTAKTLENRQAELDKRINKALGL